MRGRRGRRGGRRGGARDPLAQSFFISEQNGIFLTSCDVFFESTVAKQIALIEFNYQDPIIRISYYSNYYSHSKDKKH